MDHKNKHTGLVMQMCAVECDTLATINLSTHTSTVRSLARKFGRSRSSGRSTVLICGSRGPSTSGGIKLCVGGIKLRVQGLTKFSRIKTAVCAQGQLCGGEHSRVLQVSVIHAEHSLMITTRQLSFPARAYKVHNGRPAERHGFSSSSGSQKPRRWNEQSIC